MYYVRLKFNSFWGIDEATFEAEAKVKAKLLLAELILNGTATLEIVERDFPEENKDE